LPHPQPGFIEEQLLMGGVPQRADLLGLTPGGKGLLLHSQRNELLEMLRFGIIAAGLPLRHRSPRDMQQLGQARLGQAELCPQRQDPLAEGIVALTI
jgi:hypothetical protein